MSATLGLLGRGALRRGAALAPACGVARRAHSTAPGGGSTPQGARGTVDPEEIARFKRLAPTWWDKNGPMKELHNMNPARIEWAAGVILRETGRGGFGGKVQGKCLEGLRILDVGCGAGIATEALGELGATVTGVDANPDAIDVARLRLDGEARHLQGNVQYVCGSLDEHLETLPAQYDAVVSFEVIEHVNQTEMFVQSLADSVKPGAPLCLSTINKNPLSFALAIAFGEYLTRMVPVGTHDWEKFLTPDDLAALLSGAGCIATETKGLQPCPAIFPAPKLNWSVSNDPSVNYLMAAIKAK